MQRMIFSAFSRKELIGKARFSGGTFGGEAVAKAGSFVWACTVRNAE